MPTLDENRHSRTLGIVHLFADEFAKIHDAKLSGGKAWGTHNNFGKFNGYRSLIIN